ncbi:Coenzyme PQQ biosynthesis protein A [Hyella patelloides LEGE 07179]|uniref:Coenzyme PQQ synthesis protein A n=1 Tax=Hyella patelloides LEGE 07179 TaxID=945734 RepID=A0A563W1T9_9CYAN|nr:pyrroloquinoline quinone precursor peptide PqqA [Hyella patelloides]VEP17641.1 Coenzyme PQQ biosynthesis protein A [Hyella patelloides LEGE 07179]
MMHQTNNYSICAKQDTSVANSDSEKGSKNSAPSSMVKPTAVWESPEFEEFDLCMEVTAYVQQWD